MALYLDVLVLYTYITYIIVFFIQIQPTALSYRTMYTYVHIYSNSVVMLASCSVRNSYFSSGVEHDEGAALSVQRRQLRED